MTRKKNQKVGRIISGKHKITNQKYLTHPFIIVMEDENYFVCAQTTTSHKHYQYGEYDNKFLGSDKYDNFSSNTSSIFVFLNSKKNPFKINYSLIKDNDNFLINQQNIPQYSNFYSLIDKKPSIIDFGDRYYLIDKSFGLKFSSFLKLDCLYVFPKSSVNSDFYYIKNKKIDQKVLDHIQDSLFNNSNLGESLSEMLKGLSKKNFN